MSSGYGDLVCMLATIIGTYLVLAIFSVSTVWLHKDCYNDIGWSLVVTYWAPVPIAWVYLCCLRWYCHACCECLFYLLAYCGLFGSHAYCFYNMIQLQKHSSTCVPKWVLIGDWVASSAGLVATLVALLIIAWIFVVDSYWLMKLRKSDALHKQTVLSLYARNTDAAVLMHQSKIRNTVRSMPFDSQELKIFTDIFVLAKVKENTLINNGSDECVNCGMLITSEQRYFVLPGCHHQYHEQCLKNYLLTSCNNCSVCNNNIRHAAIRHIHNLDDKDSFIV